LLTQLNTLDMKVEDNMLSLQEADYKSCLHVELTKLLREEELYRLQRSKATRLVHDDDNTIYFQLLANSRYRKARIYQLQREECVIVGEENLKLTLQNFIRACLDLLKVIILRWMRLSLRIFLRSLIYKMRFFQTHLVRMRQKESIVQMEHNKSLRPHGF
jgi:hypothetical protein